MLILALGSMAGFFVGQAMHGVMGDQGFGVFGNTGVLVAGALFGLSLLGHFDLLGIGIDKVSAAVIAAAFAVLFLTVCIKRFVIRF